LNEAGGAAKTSGTPPNKVSAAKRMIPALSISDSGGDY
jgi:hypothetical protein